LGLPRIEASVLVAVSGGADSAALLLAVNELVPQHLDLQVIVVHLDHGLRKRSQEDEEWVTALAAQFGNEIVSARANVKKRAKETSDNLEQAARLARYEFFGQTAAEQNVKLILTAHTMDDQAETVLLRLLRGSGADGLGGIEPVRTLKPQSEVLLVRPLLSWARRTDTENYCRQKKVRFRVDEMNDDMRFARVRVRKQLVPLLESFNGRIVETIARTAELLRDDAAVLNRSARHLLREAEIKSGMSAVGAPSRSSGGAKVAVKRKVSKISPNPKRTNRSATDLPAKTETAVPFLSVDVLSRAPTSLRRRALRLWESRRGADRRPTRPPA